MEKFSLNESLRIYLPGLFLSILLFIILNVSLDGVEMILLPAIFIALLFNVIFGKFHKKYFEKRVEIKEYNNQWNEIISFKLGSTDLKALETSNKMLDFIEGAYFSKRYTSVELTYFRYPKSMGVMFYNLMIVCFVGIGLSFGKLVFTYLDSRLELIQIFIIVGLGLAAFLFFLGSKYFFDSSLYRELAYWRSINEDEAKEVSEILELWKLNNINNVEEDH
ncbi:hypothetical protein ABN763_17940 [Spongiivirga sp. MCCC 1A20706]|uniref:hypothetical protein n=1 Tax=Spongiivirga sp. MCCC 1A20706 TaxID=3160963 RepID=UPI003977588C